MAHPTHTALGTWSGGRFMHFGEELDDERLTALVRPGDDVRTVLTADVYGQGEADAVLGRALRDVRRDDVVVVGAVGHDFYEGERQGAKGFPRFTDPALRGPEGYADYLRRATERSLERIGIDRFDLLLLHNPDRTGYTSEAVWDGMSALREAGLTGLLGIAPGPANGFTLDLITAFERFGDRLDWAMLILNPMEPWPGELALRRRGPPRHLGPGARRRLRGPVLGRRHARARAAASRPPGLPAGGLDRGRARAPGAHAPDRRAARADDAPARGPVGPRARPGAQRRAHADPGGRARGAPRRGQARRARRHALRGRPVRGGGRPSCGRSATTPAAWR